MDKEEILKQAKKIMDNFHSALAKIEKEVPESRVERDEFERKEGEGLAGDKEFREIMFKNAKETRDDFIVAEKGEWEE